MKNKKQIYFVFVGLLTMLSTLSSMTASELIHLPGFDNVVTNVDLQAMHKETLSNVEIIVPHAIINPDDNQAYTVTAIARNSFDSKKDANDLFIPNTIEQIDSFAFAGFSNLQQVIFEANSKLQKLNRSSFEFCYSLEEIVLPATIHTIEDYVFYNCKNLNKVELPQSLENLYEKSFSGLNNLQYVIAKSTNPPIIKKANGESGSAIAALVFENSAIISAQLTVPQGAVVQYNIAPWNQFRTISEKSPLWNVFQSGTLFFQVNDEFSNTVKLVNQHWPAIGYDAGAFPAGDIVVPHSVIHPVNKQTYNVTEIAAYAFAYDKELTGITIPNTIEKIDSFAFRECRNLKNINFERGSKINRIYRSMCEYCTSLENIDLPDGVTTVEDWAFLECKNLKRVTLPEAIQEVYEFSFRDCLALEEFRVWANQAPTIVAKDAGRTAVPAWLFFNTPIANTQLLVPFGALKNYKKQPWSGFKKTIEAEKTTNVSNHVKNEKLRIHTSNGLLYIETFMANDTLRIFTMDGMLVFSKQTIENEPIILHLPKGNYLIQLNSESQKISI